MSSEESNLTNSFLKKACNARIMVVLPAYNEEGKIGRVVSGIKQDVEPGLIDIVMVIDDGSTDKTVEDAKAAGAHVISKPKNAGIGAAIRTGIDYALDHKFDIVIVMAGDDQDLPVEIPKVLAPIVSKGYDFVQGSRRLYGKRVINMPNFRRFTTKMYSVVFNFLVETKVTDGTNGFRAFKLDILKDKRINLWQDWLDTYELEPYLFYQTIKCGFKVTEVPVTKRYHKFEAYTKMVPFRDWWRITRPIIFLRFGIKK
ncbi:MAG: glycosyltransferase family 2 protein [Thermodesulfobacteriota bacterium]